ncbi:hypothetical protein OAV88_01525 [bacterium]|nr:hypothetical protein [bacterium]
MQMWMSSSSQTLMMVRRCTLDGSHRPDEGDDKSKRLLGTP